MHDPRLTYIYMRKDSLLQCMHEAAAQHRTPLISPISLQSKTKLGFNFVEPLWYGSSWPRSQSERGKSNLEWKKNTFILSNYNELVDFSIRSEVSFRSDMHNCFKAVVKQKWKKIRSHTLGARGVGPLGGSVCEPLWGLFCLLERVSFDSEDLKRVRALSPLGQKRTAWIRTGNLSVI